MSKGCKNRGSGFFRALKASEKPLRFLWRAAAGCRCQAILSGAAVGYRRGALPFFAALCLSIFLTISVRSQTNTQPTLGPPQIDAFPQVSAYLDYRDGEGNFIPGLRAVDVTVLENSQALVPLDLQALQPGVQFVVAINPGRSFAIRDGQGFSRYDYLRVTLEEWARSPEAEDLDDLSLLATTGLEETHLSSRADWLAGLQAYEPDLRSATPSLDVLSRALDVVADATPRAGMGRAVLFITPPPDLSALTALENLAARANDAGVRIFVWLVTSPELFDLAEARALQELAGSTGGSFFAFSGIEAPPDLEAALAPLRQVYVVVYESQITASGSHELAVQIGDPETGVLTPPRFFDLEIAPPNPILVSLPAQITRRAPGDELSAPVDLVPQTQPLEILIEYPDGHPRQLQRTSLYIDGELVAENTAPPFERFVWDLRGYDTAGRRTLRVEAVDILGLQGTSIETPVQINIEQPRQDALAVLSRNGPMLAGAAIVMAGAILLFVLVVGGRIRPRPRYGSAAHARANGGRKTRPAASRLPTQPVPGRRFGNWAAELPNPMAKQPKPEEAARNSPYAFLTRITTANGEKADSTPIPLVTSEVVIGSDPSQASMTLNDPSVDGLHARLRRTAEGAVQLQDQGSVAGTWVNYAPLSQEWADIEDGDLIHIGRMGFRFSFGKQPRRRPPKITFEKKESR